MGGRCSQLSIADSQPQAAFSAVTHGLYSKWNYLARTTPDIKQDLQPLEAGLNEQIKLPLAKCLEQMLLRSQSTNAVKIL